MSFRDSFVTWVVVIVLCGGTLVAEKYGLPHVEPQQPRYFAIRDPGQVVANASSNTITINVKDSARDVRDKAEIVITNAWRA
jgi:hypothetical protein